MPHPQAYPRVSIGLVPTLLAAVLLMWPVPPAGAHPGHVGADGIIA